MEARKGPIVGNKTAAKGEEILEGAPVADEDEEVMTSSFSPGTFVEIRRGDRIIQGVVLGEAIHNQRWRVLTLTTKGQIALHYRADVFFAIPNFISASLAERCSTSQEPTEQQIAARVEVLKRLRSLTTKVDKQAQGLQQKPMNVYIEVMSDDPNRWTTTTVNHVTSLLYERPLFMDYYMTHKYLMDRPLQYVAIPGYLRNQTFAVRPRRDIEEIQEVEKHIYAYRDQPNTNAPFKRFIEKAQRVVTEYDRKKPDLLSSPVGQEPSAVSWDAEDQIFLRVLLRSLQQHNRFQADPYTLSRTTIIKHILRPTVPVTDALAHELVIKLGIIAPWQGLLELSSTVNPWGDFENKKSLEKEADTIMRSSRKAAAGAVLGPLDLLPSDPLESVRHDFGDARVLVIDDASAEELDDGISVERIPSEPDNYWVHVHIADPARILHPEHALSKVARQRFSTYYLIHRTYPLFPKALVHDPVDGLSLVERPDGEPHRVLTFSVKVDSEANILDYTVRAGLVRNVRRATYDDVDLALGNAPLRRRFPFGGSLEVKKPIPVNEEDLNDLRLLQKLASDQVAKRHRQGLYNFSMAKGMVVLNSKIPESIRSPSLRGSTYSGAPDATYAVWEAENEDSGSRSLVSEMMKLANRAASRFAIDHNIPIVRRAMEPGVATPEAHEEILSMRSPAGYVPIQEIIKRLTLNPAASYTIQPLRHHGLGVPEGEGYTRATSPLRRFEDLVIHWQLHHALLGSKAPISAPFNIGETEALAAEFEAKNLATRKLHNDDATFHSLVFLKRYADETAKGVQRPFGDPLSSMRAWSRRVVKKSLLTNNLSAIVHLPDLGIDAMVEDVPISHKSMPIGTDLCVKLDRIDLGIKKNKMIVSIVRS
ncbi:hypothetical protein CVT26_002924 [Gymnopilus dilepis]|uniref:RNB domain-containing protein n=1 Tax=Gymnopilus dilepis TaxID=231916 RepID=A0A409VQS7_9AGAR|nr:hypothetical protein CVT26_002924 [Gymnopilus dilepis]